MLFVSFAFAIFITVVLVGLLVLRSQDKKVLWLLLAGVVFYGYWNWRFLALIAFTSVLDLDAAETYPARLRALLRQRFAPGVRVIVVEALAELFTTQLLHAARQASAYGGAAALPRLR